MFDAFSVTPLALCPARPRPASALPGPLAPRFPALTALPDGDTVQTPAPSPQPTPAPAQPLTDPGGFKKVEPPIYRVL